MPVLPWFDPAHLAVQPQEDAGESKYNAPIKEAHAEAGRTVRCHEALLLSVMTGMPGNPENKGADHSLHLTEARQDRGYRHTDEE